MKRELIIKKALQRGYAIKSELDENTWRKICKQHEIPFVFIQNKRKYVEMIYETDNAIYLCELSDEDFQLLQNAWEKYVFSQPKPIQKVLFNKIRGFNKTVGHFPLLVSDLPEIMPVFVDIIHRARPRKGRG
ncbi:MAG: hypothetical protein K6T65_08810 [Peptococcaceae bacterium]|nr:hypothetical protein [Peptococcaceae bacterium]